MDFKRSALLRWWQTRIQCCEYILVGTNVSPFARTRNNFCGYKICIRDTRHVFDFRHKHFVSATNASPFARHGHKTFVLCPARLPTQERSRGTRCLQQCVFICHHLWRSVGYFIIIPRNRMARIESFLFTEILFSKAPPPTKKKYVVSILM